MKRVFSWILAVALMVVLTACGTTPNLEQGETDTVDTNGENATKKLSGKLATAKVLIQPSIEGEGAEAFSEGLAAVAVRGYSVEDATVKFVDKTGKVVFELGGEYITDSSFSEGLTRVYERKWEYWKNDNGKIETNPEPATGYTLGITEQKLGFADKTGAIVITPEYEEVGGFSEGLAWVRERTVFDTPPEDRSYLKTTYGYDTRDGKYGFIDKKGNVVISLEYEEVGDFSEGLACVKMLTKKDPEWSHKNEYKWGFIDKKGKVVIPFEYEEVGNFSDGVVWVSKKDDFNEEKYGVIDKNNKTIIPFGEYDKFKDCSEGLIPVMKDDKCGFLDKKGNVVVPIRYTNVFSFNEGLAIMGEGNEGIVINKKGEFVTSLPYDLTDEKFYNGILVVQSDSKFGCIDIAGNVIVPIKYDHITNFKEGFALFKDSYNGYGILQAEVAK